MTRTDHRLSKVQAPLRATSEALPQECRFTGSCAPIGAIGDLGIILNSATVQSPYPAPWSIRAPIPRHEP
jgi:hypothetical protein